MKITGFVGSPHKSGNTVWVVEQILNGAKEKGIETISFNYADLNIKPCGGCLSCKNGDSCVIKDDMGQIYSELKKTDAIVFGSPVYMGLMSAQAKTFMDRFFAVRSPRFSPYYKEQTKKKKLLLVFTQGNPDKTKFKEHFDYVRQMFEMLEYDVKDVVVVSGTRTMAAKDMDGLSESLNAVGADILSGEDNAK